MKNFSYECNGKEAGPVESEELSAKCKECECDEGSSKECECECHSN